MRRIAIASLVVLVGCHASSRQSGSPDAGPPDGQSHSDRLETDVSSVIGRACVTSEACGASAWCNPAVSACQLRSTPKVSFSRAVNPIFNSDSCETCHSGVGDIGAVTGTSGVPLIFSQADPYQSWTALVAGGTNCSDGLSRRVCVDDPQKSLLALFPLRIPGQAPFDSTELEAVFTSWSDPDLQTLLEWIAEGAPFDGPDGGTKFDAGPTDATTTDARPIRTDAQPDIPSRPDPLGALGPLTLAAAGCSAEQVSWRAATSDPTLASGVSYDVCYTMTASGCANGVGTHQTVVGATTTALNSLSPGTYYVLVSARDDAGDVATAATDSFPIALIPPGTPQGLAVTPSTSSPTVLGASWTVPAAGCTPAASYQICISTTSSGCGAGSPSSWTTSASLTATSTVLTGLTPSTTYYLFVRSVAADGNTVGTPAVASATTGTPPDTTPPSAITAVSVTDSSSSCHAVTASWSMATDDRSTASQISYDVCYSTNTLDCNSGAGTHQSVAAGTISAVISGLSVATPYYLVVRAIDAANNKNMQTVTPTSFSIPPATPVTPTSLAAGLNGQSASSLSLSWSPGQNSDCTAVSGYEVCGSTAGACTTAGPWSAPTSVSATAAVVSGLTSNTPYYLSVRAVDGLGNASAPAATATTTMTLCSFTNNVAPFLATSCNGSCHASILPTPISYTTLSNMAGGPNACTNDIDPSTPTQSFIYLVTQGSYCGSIQMNPAGDSIIATWISQGGYNN
jgi:hypothetical protein